MKHDFPDNGCDGCVLSGCLIVIIVILSLFLAYAVSYL